MKLVKHLFVLTKEMWSQIHRKHEAFYGIFPLNISVSCSHANTINDKSPWHAWIRLHANALTSYFGNRSNEIIGIESPFPPHNVGVWRCRIYYDKQHWIGGKGGELINCLTDTEKCASVLRLLSGIVVLTLTMTPLFLLLSCLVVLLLLVILILRCLAVFLVYDFHKLTGRVVV